MTDPGHDQARESDRPASAAASPPDSAASSSRAGAGVGETLVRNLVAATRRRPLSLIPAVGLLLAVALFGLELLRLVRIGNGFGGLLVDAFYGAWTVGLLMLLTVGLRTLRVRDVVRTWLFGFFAVTGLVALVGSELTEAMLTSGVGFGNVRSAAVIPILEETVKALPLLIVLALAVIGRTREPSASDLAILGFAIGAAFAFHENALWVRRISDGFDASAWGVLFPSLSLEVGVVGHAGWTGLVGAALGVAWRLQRHPWVWFVPGAAFVIASLDHGYANVRGESAEVFAALTMDGQLVPVLLALGLVAAVAVDSWALWRTSEEHPFPEPLTWNGMRKLVAGLPGRIAAKVLAAAVLLGARREATASRLRASRRGTGEAVPAGG